MAGHVLIRLDGHLSRAALDEQLASVAPRIGRSGDRPWLIVDALSMTGYDADAREGFVTWNRVHRRQVEGVAIVTERLLWRMVVAAMSLASGQRMRTFDAVEAAEEACR